MSNTERDYVGRRRVEKKIEMVEIMGRKGFVGNDYIGMCTCRGNCLEADRACEVSRTPPLRHHRVEVGVEMFVKFTDHRYASNGCEIAEDMISTEVQLYQIR
ncbi:hypothetical protein SAY87_012195 [Trapa incisa]|uniref:Uncharacterized protein n=1 Tax=Trapa incisa TaxID=236973 RepID=A0AAN7JJY6_9MYRT|nr:hypothetical protein SAY87_012195 [Trapa incisa]